MRKKIYSLLILGSVLITPFLSYGQCGGPITVFPWTENFDALTSVGATSFPVCWIKENGDWQTATANTYNTSFSGPNHLRDNWSASNEYMWTPGFDLVANTSYDFSFFVAGDGWTGWNVDVFQNTTQNSAGATQIGNTFTAPGPGSLAIQPYTKQTHTFVPPANGTYYFAIRVNQASSSPYYIAFDDFQMELTPSCPAPQSLTATTTATTATLQWIAPGPATQWQIEYAPNANFILGAGTRLATGTNPHTLGNLLSSTGYSYFVRAVCGPGDTSAWSYRGYFTTQCAGITTLPWTENFDALTSVGAASFPMCWVVENGDWETSDDSTFNIPFSGQNYLTDAWSASNEYMWTPGFDLVANTSYDFSFFVAGDGWTGWNVDVFQNTTQNSAGATQIGNTFTAPGPGSLALQPYTKQTYTFVPPANGTYYFAIRVNQASSSPYYIAFDDFKVELTPSCPAPQSLTATTTATTATLQWVAPGPATQWQIEYAPNANFSPGAGTRLATGNNPHTLGNLLHSTGYSYFVRAVCGPGDTSAWSSRGYFTTQCAGITTLPWTENFDALTSVGATSFPVCWIKENGDWETTTANTYNTSFSGPNHLRDDWSASNEYMWTPGFNLVANTSYDFSFFVAGDGWTGWNVDVFQNTIQNSAGATQIGNTFTAPGPGSLAIQPYTKQTHTFVPPANGTYYFAIRVNQASSSPYYIAFDDFQMELTPSCPAPQSLTATTTATTATLQWAAPGSATQWQIEYAPNLNFIPGAGTRLATGTNPHTLGNLLSSTGYSYFVRAVCGPGDTSAWSYRGYFTTQCGSITTLPWTENFDALTSVGAASFPVCWIKENGDWETATANTYSTSFSGPNHLRDDWSASNEYIWTPGFDLVANTSYDFSFFVAGDGWTGWNVDVFQNTTQNSAGATQIGNTFTAPGPGSLALQPYTKQIYTFVPPANGTYYFAIRVNQASSSPYYIAFDDFKVEENPLAIKLGKLSVTNMGTSNKIDWNTLSEERSDRFELEKSLDGKSFYRIHEIQANGKPSRYTYLDVDAAKGWNYYRLRMTEANGNVTYSQIVTAFVKPDGFDIQAFPNPVSHEMTVKISGLPGANAMVQVTDLTGKVLQTMKMNASVATIDMSRLASGSYLIKYSDTNHTQILKVNKQ